MLSQNDNRSRQVKTYLNFELFRQAMALSGGNLEAMRMAPKYEVCTWRSLSKSLLFPTSNIGKLSLR